MTNEEIDKEVNELYAKIKPGTKFRFCDRTINTVVTTLKDGEEDLIVFKYYNQHKKRWYYYCNYAYAVLSIIPILKQEYEGDFAEGKEKK